MSSIFRKGAGLTAPLLEALLNSCYPGTSSPDLLVSMKPDGILGNSFTAVTKRFTVLSTFYDDEKMQLFKEYFLIVLCLSIFHQFLH